MTGKTSNCIVLGVPDRAKAVMHCTSVYMSQYSNSSSQTHRPRKSNWVLKVGNGSSSPLMNST